MPGFASLSMFTSTLFVLIPGLAAFLFISGVSLLMRRLLAPLSMSFVSGVFVPLLGSFTFPSISFVSDVSALLPRLLSFYLQLECLCLCLGYWLLRLKCLCLVYLYLYLGYLLLCVYLLYLCMSLDCLPRFFPYGFPANTNIYFGKIMTKSIERNNEINIFKRGFFYFCPSVPAK